MKKFWARGPRGRQTREEISGQVVRAFHSALPQAAQTFVQVPQSSEVKNSPRFTVTDARAPESTYPAMIEFDPPLSFKRSQ